MKKLLILLLLIPSFGLCKEPKFSKNDIVIYPVRPFYRNVCSGEGTIKEYEIDNNGTIWYLLITESGCPNTNLPESDLKLKEEK